MARETEFLTDLDELWGSDDKTVCDQGPDCTVCGGSGVVIEPLGKTATISTLCRHQRNLSKRKNHG